jgi:3-methyladenine DNA glycosylase/8-oxoguanine DNA glycosylase
VQTLLAQPVTPTIEDVTAFGKRWSPWRTFAAALLWASLRPVVPAG